uniref:Selenoprotein F n=1 Tax=Echeneis naucrates TaxID=173247 RepID=A0A665UCD5_ECHNA
MDTTFEKIKGPQHCIIIVLLFGLTHTTSPSSLQLSAYGADLSSEACRELGFSSNLLCSSCDLLGEFSLSKLQPDCRQCCQQEAQMEARKLYAGAILEVFQAFVRSEKPKMFKGLQIKVRMMDYVHVPE